MLQLLDELKIGEAVFIGTSLGGLVTMIIAGFSPQRIAGAVLNDVGPELDQAGLDRIRSYVGQPVLFHNWDEAAEKLSAKHGSNHPAYGKDEWLRYARRVCRATDRGGGVRLRHGDCRAVQGDGRQDRRCRQRLAAVPGARPAGRC